MEHFRGGEIMKSAVDVVRRNDPWRQRKDGAVPCRYPRFGQAQREDEHVALFEHATHGRKVAQPVGPEMIDRREPLGLNRWPKWVDHISFVSGPVVSLRHEKIIRSVKKL